MFCKLSFVKIYLRNIQSTFALKRAQYVKEDALFASADMCVQCLEYPVRTFWYSPTCAFRFSSLETEHEVITAVHLLNGFYACTIQKSFLKKAKKKTET